METKHNRHFVAGERIYLREVRLTDINANYCRWMNDPEVTRYTESRFSTHSKENLIEYVQSKIDDLNYIFLAIIINDIDRHIGNIKIGPINWIHRFADLGIMIGEKDCWGKGFATEAIRVVTDYAFTITNLHRLTAGAYATNIGSIRAFLKAGWQQEGIKKSQYYFEGSYVDGVLLGITQTEWSEHRKNLSLDPK